MDLSLKKFNKLVNTGSEIVFFGGAGVSTESFIPDFRSVDGLYSDKKSNTVPVEKILSLSYFYSDPENFYDFYFSKMIYPDAIPNDAHRALSYLESEGRLDGIVTQNIDGLHTKAGSRNVVELHGSINRNHCTKCSRFYTLKEILDLKPLPRCSCSGLIKPDVVLYDEMLDQKAIERAVSLIKHCRIIIIGGTSLTVHPAASLVRYFSGEDLIIINKTETPLDKYADIVIREPIGKVFKQIMD